MILLHVFNKCNNTIINCVDIGNFHIDNNSIHLYIISAVKFLRVFIEKLTIGVIKISK